MSPGKSIDLLAVRIGCLSTVGNHSFLRLSQDIEPGFSAQRCQLAHLTMAGHRSQFQQHVAEGIARQKELAIHSAASGEELLRLTPNDLPALGQNISIGALEQLWAQRLHLSRFRQRLLTDGELLDDELNLTLPLNLQLVKLEFSTPEDERDRAFVEACAQHKPARCVGPCQYGADPTEPACKISARSVFQ